MIWFHFQRNIGEDAAKLLKTLREDQNDDSNKEYFKLLKEFLEIVETIKAEVVYLFDCLQRKYYHVPKVCDR